MTEYELVDAIQAVAANTISNFLALMTLISGYLVVAYMIGSKLSKLQNSIVTSLFLVISFLILGIQYQLLVTSIELYSRLITLSPDWPVQVRPIALYMTLGVWLSIVAACLKFMHDIRITAKGNP